MNDRIEDLINGLAGRVGLLDRLMTFTAKDLIVLVALALVMLWFGLPLRTDRATNQRVVLAAALGAIAALGLGALIGHLHPEARPFVTDRSTRQLIPHAPDNGLPSDHALVSFAVAGTVVWWRRVVGGVLFACALLIGVARVYVGVHWPGDIAVGAAVGILAGGLAAWTVPWWAEVQRRCPRYLPPWLLARP